VSFVTPSIDGGDVHDDDYWASDQTTEGMAYEKPEATAVVDPTPPILVPQTRILSGTMLIMQTWGEVQILPADVYRSELVIAIATETATDYVLVGGHAEQLQTEIGCGRVYADKELRLDSHTGEVWVRNTVVDTTTAVSWWAVTRG
jgi:hypothetical protein